MNIIEDQPIQTESGADYAQLVELLGRLGLKVTRRAVSSDNFETGISGWQLTADGNVEANNGTFRGTITAGSVRTTRSLIAANTDAATITLNWSLANVHRVTLGGNRTIAFSNKTDGQEVIFMVSQDASGNRTLTWPATVKWAGGVTPTLTTTGSRTDIFGFIRNATADVEFGYIIGQNYNAVPGGDDASP